MAEHPGAHGRTGATSSPTTPASPTSEASTDASLNARVRTPHRRPWAWLAVAAVAVVAVVIGIIAIVNRPATQQAGRRDTVTIGLKLAPTNLDIRNQSGSALDQILIGNVYEGLVARDENNPRSCPRSPPAGRRARTD